MDIILLEDEVPGMEQLAGYINRYDSSIQVLAMLRSVEESSAWLSSHRMPDLVISDIHLSDGLVFKAFDKLDKLIPVIFTTAYDEYLLKAFEYNSVAYILKPINYRHVVNALDKFRSIKEHYKPDVEALQGYLGDGIHTPKRMVARGGGTFKGFEIGEVAYFYSRHKITFVVLSHGERLMIDKSLQQLEEELPATDFFRINRSMISSWKGIVGFKSFEKGKLSLEVVPAFEEPIIISQEKSSDFKVWYGKR